MTRARKKDEGGAPGYMQLYTTMMVLLLAFFIVLCGMAQDQESGFNSGIGQVKDAFGITGGVGLLQYYYYKSGAPGRSQTPQRTTAPEDGSLGIGTAFMQGLSGAGMTDADAQRVRPVPYLRLTVPASILQDSDRLSPELCEYLRRTGAYLALRDDQLVIRCWPRPAGAGDPLLRAARVMRFLHESAGVPYARMTAVGSDGPVPAEAEPEAAAGGLSILCKMPGSAGDRAPETR